MTCPDSSEGHLCGADIASVDASTLEMLHLSTPEDRELLLSNIYRELHPPNSLTRRLDSLIGMSHPPPASTIDPRLTCSDFI